LHATRHTATIGDSVAERLAGLSIFDRIIWFSSVHASLLAMKAVA
jgi:hypothetical protein